MAETGIWGLVVSNSNPGSSMVSGVGSSGNVKSGKKGTIYVVSSFYVDGASGGVCMMGSRLSVNGTIGSTWLRRVLGRFDFHIVGGGELGLLQYEFALHDFDGIDTKCSY